MSRLWSSFAGMLDNHPGIIRRPGNRRRTKRTTSPRLIPNPAPARQAKVGGDERGPKPTSPRDTRALSGSRPGEEHPGLGGGRVGRGVSLLLTRGRLGGDAGPRGGSVSGARSRWRTRAPCAQLAPPAPPLPMDLRDDARVQGR